MIAAAARCKQLCRSPWQLGASVMVPYTGRLPDAFCDSGHKHQQEVPQLLSTHHRTGYHNLLQEWYWLLSWYLNIFEAVKCVILTVISVQMQNEHYFCKSHLWAFSVTSVCWELVYILKKAQICLDGNSRFFLQKSQEIAAFVKFVEGIKSLGNNLQAAEWIRV